MALLRVVDIQCKGARAGCNRQHKTQTATVAAYCGMTLYLPRWQSYETPSTRAVVSQSVRDLTQTLDP